MAYLKEDGSLDVERINKLPIEEHIYEIAHFTKEQRKEYISSLSLNESQKTIPIIHCSLRKELESGNLVNAWDVINNL